MADTVLAGRYRLDEPLGGSMSEVYLATDLELERRVVVKLVGPGADQARFEREAHAAASLADPNIVQVFDYGEADGRPYMVLEHLGGGSLEDRLEAGLPLPDAESARIARDIATGLAHAHARGLVHRDLKPANILFDSEGRAKIADFGIARLGNASTLTEDGTVMGTASYIAPEQAAGEPATPASDVYSFGVLLFRMLTGQLPFTAPSMVELIRLHQEAAPPNVADLRPDAPAQLESVAAASLAKNPADRPRDGTALLANLGGIAAEAPTTVLPTVPLAAAPATSGRPARVPLAVIGLAVLVLVLAGAALALVLTQDNSAPASPVTSVSFSLPSTSETTTSAATSTAATTAEEPTTPAAATTSPPPTTAPATTAPPATTQPPPTTEPATTTIDTVATTTIDTVTTPTTVTTAPTPAQPTPGG